MEGLTQSKEFILHDFMHNHEGCDYDFQHLKKKILVYLTEGWTWWFVKFLPFQFL